MTLKNALFVRNGLWKPVETENTNHVGIIRAIIERILTVDYKSPV